MRVLIINPNSDQETETLLRNTAERFIDGRFDFDVVSAKTAPKLVVTYEDQYSSAAELAAIVRAHLQTCDAFIIACHADPSLDLIREVAAGKPVFGIAQSSMQMAGMQCGGFAVLTPAASIIPKKYALARKYHLEEQLKAVVVCGGNDRDSLLAAAREAQKVPNVSGIVLGCANYAGADGYLSRELGMPVYDGLIWAIVLAEGAVRVKRYLEKNES